MKAAKPSRRDFLRLGAGGAMLALAPFAAGAQETTESGARPACLFDATRCIGCRKCEEACNLRHELPAPPLSWSDRSVFDRARRPDDRALTVVNRYAGPPAPGLGATRPTFVKFQCQHCLKPSCVSACISGALTRAADGSVVYDPRRCIGCRYCMVACPFQIPAYEYRDPLKPKVVKCDFCADPARGRGADPACAAACPAEALVFGERARLLESARARIEARPDLYLDHVYGEREAGGTSWLYLAGRPFEEIGLLPLPDRSPAVRTEAIQRGVYRFGLAPLALYGLLGGIMWRGRRRKGREAPPEPPAPAEDGEERP